MSNNRRSGRFDGTSTLISVLWCLTVVQLFNQSVVRAFIPAQPVNDTSSFNQSQDLITVAFYNGVYQAPISRQLTAEAFDDAGNYTTIETIVSWTRFSKGVLVHFDEADRNQGPSNVPWIAMISCDTNGTNYSLDDDIFTLTRDQGAQAALLYSLNSQGCLMNQEYLQNFSKVLDVYATTSISASRIIENQFFNPGISTDAFEFNASLLNASITTIESLLTSSALYVTGNVPTNASLAVNTTTNDTLPDSTNSTNTTDSIDSTNSTAILENFAESTSSPTSSFTSLPNEMRQRQRIMRRATSTRTISSASATASKPPNYLAAVLAASNNTVGGPQNSPAPSATATPAAKNGGAGTSLAMIVLYAITGLVTFMFLVVITSGAIRAIRHPERYGPRATMYDPDHDGLGEGYSQTRTQGLTRAILDTFPIVKFGRGAGTTANGVHVEGGGVGTNPHSKAVELDQMHGVSTERVVVLPNTTSPSSTRRKSDDEIETLTPLARKSTSSEERRALTHKPSIASEMSFVSAFSTPETTAGIPAPTAINGTAAPTLSTTSPPEASTSTATAQSHSIAAALPITTNPVDVDDGTTCPVCLCEFDEGDDLRVLPCDARHQFHCECIDPWLLNVSSHCPLCRLDLNGAIKAKNQHPTQAPPRTSSEAEVDEEEVVRANLRAMLPSRNRASIDPNSVDAGAALNASVGSSTTATTTTTGSTSILTANKFFRYVARQRQRQDHADDSTTRTTSRLLREDH